MTKQQKQFPFQVGDWVVYPAHGVGYIEAFETMSVAGETLEFVRVSFKDNRMNLRIPLHRALSTGLRKVSSLRKLQEAMKTLRQKAKKKGGILWMQRTALYEEKLHSGDICAVAEIVRDLYQAKEDIEVSYSEKSLFEAALERLTKEVQVVENIPSEKATTKVLSLLKR